MLYSVKFNDAYVNEHLAKGSIMRIGQDKKEVYEGEYARKNIPGTSTTIRLLKDQNSKPFIDISSEDLKKAVPAFGFYNSDDLKPIEDANPSLGIGGFWNHPELSLEIPNYGMDLEVGGFDITPKTNFWFSVMCGDPRFFVNDGIHERPETLNKVLFIVTPKALEQKRVTEDIKKNSLVDSYEISRMIIMMDRTRKKAIIDELGPNLYDESMNDSDLDKIILNGLSEQGEKRMYNSQTFEEYFADLAKYSPERFDFSRSVRFAQKNQIISYIGDQYYFDRTSLGSSLKEVERNLFGKKDLIKVKTAFQKAVTAAGYLN